jgi:hypothetical protein
LSCHKKINLRSNSSWNFLLFPPKIAIPQDKQIFLNLLLCCKKSKMNSLIKILKTSRPTIRLCSYSTASGSEGGSNLEPSDILSNDEIELEVNEM